jgi:hypothetical protein
VLVLLACLAFGAWWTATPRTAQQAIGWCAEQRGQEVRLIRCGRPAHKGFRIRGKVFGTHPFLVDYVGEPPEKWYAPDDRRSVLSPVPPRNYLLCIDFPWPNRGRATGRSLVKVVADELGPSLLGMAATTTRATYSQSP